MNKKRIGRPREVDSDGIPLNLSPTMINLPFKLKEELKDIGVNRSELMRTLLLDWVNKYYGIETKTAVERRIVRERQSDLFEANEIFQEKLDDVRKRHYELLKGLSQLTDGQPVYGPDW